MGPMTGAAKGIKECISRCETIPCAKYIIREPLAIARIYWGLSIIIMFLLGLALVHQNIDNWQNYPTQINADPNMKSIMELQFPTVTLCNNFQPDKFGFMRNILNLFKFQCDGEDDCRDTEGLRNLTSKVWRGDLLPNGSVFPMVTGPSLVSLATESFKAVIRDSIELHILESLFGNQNQSITFNSLLGYLSENDDSMEESGDTKMSAFYMALEYYKNTPSQSRYDLINKRLEGRLNNYGVNKDIYSDYQNFLEEFYLDLETDPDVATESLIKDAIMTFTVLNLPLVTGYGSFMTNFAYELLDLVPNSIAFGSIMDTWQISALPTRWGSMRTPSTSDEQTPLCLLANAIFWNMTGQVSNFTTIPPYEISAILSPVDTELITPRPHSMTYPDTTSFLDNEAGYDTNSYIPASFFNNTLGKILGPYIKAVMEVMYHNTLKTKAVQRERFHTFKDMYQGVFQYDDYTMYNDDEPFYPTYAADYNGNVTTSYLPDISYSRNYGYDCNNQNLFNEKEFYHIDEDLVLSLRSTYQQLVMMLLCQGPGTENNCLDQFQPVLTDSGICYAMNSPNHTQAFYNSTYNQIFTHIFEPNDTEITYNNGVGKGFSMFLILDSYKSKVPFNTGGWFSVSINQMFDFPIIRDQSIKVEIGSHTVVTVTPTEYTSTDAFRSLDISDRQCRYLNENNDTSSLFKFYTQKTCNFECRLRYSQQACNCTPWNYPQYGNDTITEICNGPRSYCFETKMDESISDSACALACLADCEYIDFASTQTSTKLDYADQCNPYTTNRVNMSHYVAQKIKYIDGEELFFYYTQLKNKLMTAQEVTLAMCYITMNKTMTRQVCEDMVQNDIAFLTIQINTPLVVVMKKDVSGSFIEKVAVIGGTIALFTGVSLLTLFELGFWAANILLMPFQNSRKLKRNKIDNEEDENFSDLKQLLKGMEKRMDAKMEQQKHDLYDQIDSMMAQRDRRASYRGHK